MCPSRQQAQHPLRVVIIKRFSEHRVVDDNGRVRREHKAFSLTLGDRTRLRFGDTTYIRVRQFTSMDGFIDVSMDHVELNAGCSQQFRASGRSRTQYDSLHPLIFTCGRMAGP